MPKLGRNERCHCGSGKKYKYCHLIRDELANRQSKKAKSKFDPAVLDTLVRRHEAREQLRTKVQGAGRPIISADFKGYKIVAVGNTLYYSPSETTQTFGDFLNNYIKRTLGSDWGNGEIAKPLQERHPILQWYEEVCQLQRQHAKTSGELFDTPATGAVIAYTSLAYNLYLLQHNVEVHAHLLSRLRERTSFYGAYYETYVAAWFILAGFTLRLEDERDSSTKHCEFTATSPSGNSYSVEAKTRLPGKETLALGNQLYKALEKSAKHRRVVFIDLNLPTTIELSEETFVQPIVDRIRHSAETMTIHGEPAPAAYVVVTNLPYHLHLREERVRRAILADGFKIPDFGFVEFTSLIEAYHARERHADIRRVLEACERYEVPATFDGELPEFAFGPEGRRFVIGETYELGGTQRGILRSGIVSEHERLAYLVIEVGGRQHIAKSELSDEEIAAYHRHPDTFFGEVQRVSGELKTPMDMFLFLLNGYKETPRERLLEFMRNATDFAELEQRTTEELRLIYAERCTWSVVAGSNPKVQ